MNYNEAIEYLTRCADDNGDHRSGGWHYVNPQDCPICHGTNDAGHLTTPGSRYGHTSAHVAPIAYRHAKWWAAQLGEELTTDILDNSMRLAVNDSDEIETDLQSYAADLAGANIDAIVTGYLDCQLWVQTDYGRETDDSGDPKLDANYDRDDVSDEYRDKIRDEFAALVYAHPLAVRMYLRSIKPSQGTAAEYFGDDFYLTREGHGVGFWDRGLGELGDYLTDIAKNAGEADMLTDNGNGELTA